jgi:hypothetical protein
MRLLISFVGGARDGSRQLRPVAMVCERSTTTLHGRSPKLSLAHARKLRLRREFLLLGRRDVGNPFCLPLTVEEVHSGLTMAVQFGTSSTVATADIGSAVASIPSDTAVV